jgi:anti-anti-sigma factor
MKHTADSANMTLTVVIPSDVLSTNTEVLRPEIFKILEDTASEAWQVLVFDLTAAKMVDSAGLNLLISVVRSVQPRGMKIRALVSNDNILRTFKFTRLDRHIELVEA